MNPYFTTITIFKSNLYNIFLHAIKKSHCFPEASVGLRIHGDLTVDPSLIEGNKSILDFCNLFDRAYWSRIKALIQDEEREEPRNFVRDNFSLSPSSKASEDQRHNPITNGS